MPLIDLRTNLKSLKYSGDQPGGGWSGKPYIQTAIPPTNLVLANPDTLRGAGLVDPIYKIQSTGNLDYPIRGGDLRFNIGTQTFTLSSKIDKERIRKFFEDKPRGNSFLRKQIGLNLTNPKIETGNSFQVVPGSNIIPGLLENTRIYNNGLNTLTQVGVQGTGVHLPRHGIFPFDYASKYYVDIVGAQNKTNNPSTNRLLILQNLKLNTRFANVGSNVNTVNKLGISLNRNLLFQYLGGPGSVYGIGSTTIRRYEDTSQAAILLQKQQSQISRTNKMVSRVSMTYDAIMNQKLNNTTQGVRTTNIQDYRTIRNDSQAKKMPSREEVYNLTMKGSADKMQSLSSFIFNNDKDPWDVVPYSDYTKDIIKFVFEAIENSEPSKSFAIFFRAMLSGFSDTNQASINSFKYLGRGEDFYTYQGFSRGISFSFKIGIQSEQEFRSTYAKVNHLISQVYPDYSESSGIMRAPIIRLTIGDYLYRVAGMLENVNITIDDNSTWDINTKLDGTRADRKQLPQVINVQCSFKPIQDFLPKRINQSNPNVPYITKQSETYLDNLIFVRKVDARPDFTEEPPQINEGVEANLVQRNSMSSVYTNFSEPVNFSERVKFSN